MTVSLQLLSVLNEVDQPSAFLEITFQRYDIAFKTDDAGRPVLLFIGRKDQTGKIKGERFARRLLLSENGEILKDHWDNKGKTDH